MAYSAFLDSSSINNDVRYGELFSLFDNAQEYFTVSHEETFDKLLSKVNQLPVKTGRTKICCEQLKRRNSAKLNSVYEQLEHVYSTREQLKSQQEDLRKTKVKQERELEEYRTQREDVTRRYLKVSKNCAKLDLEQTVVLKEVLGGSIKRLVTKLTAKEANLFTSIFPDEDGQISGSGDDENME